MAEEIKTCESSAMDAAHFENWYDAVPPCDGVGEIEVDGYLLCRGCKEALDWLSGISERLEAP